MAGNNLNTVVKNLREEQEEMSAVSRINYLFKFTQQSILVVDETSDFGAVGRQYLGELEDANAALVAVSQKMTDIQLRCRIIEQLAPNTIFDPEKSLADTVVNLLEINAQPLSIVIENAQHLSDTMINELLCFPRQFKSLRPSSHCDLLFVGNAEAHQRCHNIENSNGFDLVSISADTGKLFVANTVNKTEPHTKKISFVSVFVVLLTLLIAASVFMLIQTSDSKKSNGSSLAQLKKTSGNNKAEFNTGLEPRVKLTPLVNIGYPLSATNTEIYDALVANGANETPKDNGTAASEQRLSKQEDNNRSSQRKSEENTTKIDVSNGTINNPYRFILESNEGVVIQFASLSNLKAVEQFIDSIKSTIALSWYPKLISGQRYYVVVSSVYKDRGVARKALNKLPTNIRSQGLWLKDVKSAKLELSEYLNSAQSALDSQAKN